MEIKKAKDKDLKLVNKIYKKINFLPSTLINEIVAIAYEKNNKVGLGRIIVIDSSSCEMGGIFVDLKFRKKGIARKIVSFLIENSQKDQIYCIPFKYLKKFYSGFGFREIKASNSVPKKIAKKFKFCEKTYEQETILMKLIKK